MSALIPAVARSRGRVDPAVFGHVMRLVQHDYLPPDPRRSNIVSRRGRHHIAAVSPWGCFGRGPPLTIFEKRPSLGLARRQYSASAQAVETDIDDRHLDYHATPSFPSAPTRPPLRRHGHVGPSWAHLPPSLSTALSEGRINSPSQFRNEFDRLQCKSGQLASVETLQRVFSLFLTASEPSQWAWLSGQLGHMLAAVSDAGDFHSDVPALAEAIRAYCLAELGQDEEARAIIHASMTVTRSTEAVVHSVRALALSHLGNNGTARRQMVKAIRRGINSEGDGTHLSSTVADCFSLLAKSLSDEDMIQIMRQGRHSLRRFLTKPSERARNPLFSSVWAKWLANLDVSHSLADSSDFFLQFHFTILVQDTSRAADAHSLFTEICKRGREDDIRPSHLKSLANMSEQQGLLGDAGSVSVPTSREDDSARRHLTNQLLAHSRGDAQEAGPAEEIWNTIQATHEPMDIERFAIARLRARRGDLSATREAFGDVVHQTDAARRGQLSILLRAAIGARDAKAAETYLTDMVDFSPSPGVVNEVLQLVSWADDPDRAKRVFAIFEQIGVKPHVSAYTTMFGILARGRRLEEAEALFETMIANGVRPDSRAWSALLNAHVEVGDWDGLMQRWTALEDELQSTPAVVSTVLKALVLKGSDTSRVLDFFRRIERPTNQNWSLVLQSAADHGDQLLMETVFAEMKAQASHDLNAAKPDVFAFSIMLHYYLKTRDSPRSREVYDEMLSYEIVPSSVTYSMIIDSYAKGSKSGGFRRAEDFAMSIRRLSGRGDQSPLDAGMRIPVSRTKENLLGPLVAAAGRAQDPRLASHYFDLIAKDAEPSIPMFTKYLDVWRRAGEVNMVMRIWAEVFSLASRTISFRKATTARSQRQRHSDNVLVMPLTIVLITLGRDRRLLDIRRVWDEVRTAGFGFDATNFNQLAISLAQSGDVEGAFDVVENVLCESSETGEDANPLVEQATSSDPADAAVVSSGENLTDNIWRPPNRRAEAIAHASTTPYTSLAEHLSAPSSEHIWRPHYRTLTTLDSVISQLETHQDGRAWLGLASTEEAEDESDPDAGAVLELPHFGTCVRDPADGRPKKTTAKGLLMKLNRKYSKAMALVMFHRKKQSARRPRTAGGSSRHSGH